MRVTSVKGGHPSQFPYIPPGDQACPYCGRRRARSMIVSNDRFRKIVGGVISPLLANIALHGLEDLFHEWSLVGGKRFMCETVETFPAPPQGYRKCRPENAVTSLRGPLKAQKNVIARMPPKIYGPYPDGTWRTLRLVVNDKQDKDEPGSAKGCANSAICG